MGGLKARSAWAAGWVLVAAVNAAAAPPAQVQICAACHGPNGNSVLPDNPKLASLDAEYLRRQLVDFKSGKRKSAIMGPIVTALDADTLQALAEHFSEQKLVPGPAVDEAMAAKGKVIYEDGIVGSAVPACSGCHGNDGVGDAKYPRVAGQHATYVEKQLLAFKSGERANDVKGAMGAVAKRMSEAEMRAVAHYVAGLKED